MPDDRKPMLPEGGKARRVYLLLHDQIQGGTYGAGALLPGEERLAAGFGVSRVTVRRAMDALVSDGLVERRAGSGTTVCGAANKSRPFAADMTTLIPQLAEMGRSTTARLLSFSYLDAPEIVAGALSLTPGTGVQMAERVRLADGVPFSHLTTYVPEHIACGYSEADLAQAPLFRLLERSGVKVGSARQTVSAALAAPPVADALDISVGTALLSLRRVVRDADGNGVEYLSALYRPDMFRLEMSLERVASGSGHHWKPVVGSGNEPDGGQ